MQKDPIKSVGKKKNPLNTKKLYTILRRREEINNNQIPGFSQKVIVTEKRWK